MASSLDNSHSLWWKYFYKFIFQDSEIEAKKLKAENGKHEENGEEEEDAEEIHIFCDHKKWSWSLYSNI